MLNVIAYFEVYGQKGAHTHAACAWHAFIKYSHLVQVCCTNVEEPPRNDLYTVCVSGYAWRYTMYLCIMYAVRLHAHMQAGWWCTLAYKIIICIHTCIYTYIHTYIHTYISTHISHHDHRQARTHTRARMTAYMNTSSYVKPHADGTYVRNKCPVRYMSHMQVSMYGIRAWCWHVLTHGKKNCLKLCLTHVNVINIVSRTTHACCRSAWFGLQSEFIFCGCYIKTTLVFDKLDVKHVGYRHGTWYMQARWRSEAWWHAREMNTCMM